MSSEKGMLWRSDHILEFGVWASLNILFGFSPYLYLVIFGPSFNASYDNSEILKSGLLGSFMVAIMVGLLIDYIILDKPIGGLFDFFIYFIPIVAAFVLGSYYTSHYQDDATKPVSISYSNLQFAIFYTGIAYSVPFKYFLISEIGKQRAIKNEL